MTKRETFFVKLKPYLLCAVILTIIITACTLSLHTIQTTSSHMISMTESITKEVNNENWDKAHDDIKEFSRTWHSYKKIWSIILDHQKATTIDEQTVKITEHIITRNKSMAKSELSIMLESLKHYPHEELLLIENIF